MQKIIFFIFSPILLSLVFPHIFFFGGVGGGKGGSLIYQDSDSPVKYPIPPLSESTLTCTYLFVFIPTISEGLAYFTVHVKSRSHQSLSQSVNGQALATGL